MFLEVDHQAEKRKSQTLCSRIWGKAGLVASGRSGGCTLVAAPWWLHLGGCTLVASGTLK
eukprot:NODE_11261_length_414_cov_3.142466_g10133_i0.p1 GENE.NODE_11261_length_414_cov_3.142466_g10133_i0~~NODE_11261_length_414_cov_3.142466_g10133_i0.p1  ORF type:complete len:60 (-),score=7.62 NODE_11261_length_414_cov_3.142466_g10133_i0:78-257(-)